MSLKLPSELLQLKRRNSCCDSCHGYHLGWGNDAENVVFSFLFPSVLRKISKLETIFMPYVIGVH